MRLVVDDTFNRIQKLILSRTVIGNTIFVSDLNKQAIRLEHDQI